MIPKTKSLVDESCEHLDSKLPRSSLSRGETSHRTSEEVGGPEGASDQFLFPHSTVNG